MSDSKLVPRLRFPEFRGPWDQVPLGSLGQFLRGLTYAAPDVDSEGLLVLRSSNIQGGQLILDSELVFVKKSCPPELLLKKGDIAICMSNGSKALVGKSGEFKANYAGEVTVGAFCSIFRPSTPFAKIAFATQQYEKYVSLGIAGGNINNLKNSDLETFTFSMPSVSAEQHKIADCLSSLDNLIAAEGRKLESLRASKKGLMQKLFPRDGETVPQLRFPEFRKVRGWMKQRISNILRKDVNAVAVDPNAMYREIGIRSHGKGIFHKDPTRGSEIADKRVFWVVQDAFVVNIVFAWEQAVATTTQAEAGMIASHRFPMYVPKQGKCDTRFISRIFQSKKGKHLLGLASPGGAGRNRTLGQKEFEKLEIVVPENVEEQQKIADCLSCVDHRITVQSEKFAALLSHKKGLMQQLFPSVTEAEAEA